MSGNQDVTYALDFCPNAQWRKRGRKGVAPGPEPAAETMVPISRIARLMALAIRFEGLVRGEKIRNYAELARAGRVTRARMTQIMRLANLAPDIQEQILFMPVMKSLNERNLRPVVIPVDWDEQRRLFREMIHCLDPR